MKNYNDIDEYIGSFPHEVQQILNNVRKVVNEAAPEAVEAISYGMPTLKLRGKNLVHFAAYKQYIGFYPTPSGTEKFQAEITPYAHSKGSIHFTLDKPIPYDLIEKITKFRASEISDS
jgi:uncharacterized protein YdhG (YjbR/CyaY superfamily)